MIDTINSTIRRLPTWPFYLGSAIYAVWLFYLGLTGGLGVEPINALERAYGEAGLILLVIGLAVTPLRRYVGLNLQKFRRAIGLTTFFFILAHFTVWVVLDVQSVARVWEEIVERPFVTVGMLGFILMVPLALTSNNASVKRMGAAAWCQLHKLTYPTAILGAVHYLWLVKGFQLKPIIFFGIILVLLVTRLKFRSSKNRATSQA